MTIKYCMSFCVVSRLYRPPPSDVLPCGALVPLPSFSWLHCYIQIRSQAKSQHANLLSTSSLSCSNFIRRLHSHHSVVAMAAPLQAGPVPVGKLGKLNRQPPALATSSPSHPRTRHFSLSFVLFSLPPRHLLPNPPPPPSLPTHLSSHCIFRECTRLTCKNSQMFVGTISGSSAIPTISSGCFLRQMR
jgi:hypothetical protein